MTNISLILLGAGMFVVTARSVISRDLLFGVAYVTLFLYTIFTQIGYALVPELSAAKGLYYGEEFFLPYWVFITVSLVLSVACHRIGMAVFPPRRLYRVVRGPTGVSTLCYYALVVTLGVWLWNRYFAMRDSLRYGTPEVAVSREGFWFIAGIELYTFLVVVMYTVSRVDTRPWSRLLNAVLFCCGSILLTATAVRVGRRSMLLYPGIAIWVFEYMRARRRGRAGPGKVLVYGLAVTALLTLLTALQQVRRLSPQPGLGEVVREAVGLWAGKTSGNMSAGEMLVANDYYWPSHLLFVAMANAYVDPQEVLRSNVLNAAAGFGYPYLAETIGRTALGSGVDRVRGIAFYLFVEGYVAVGWAGILYNALLLNAVGIAFRSFAACVEVDFRECAQAVMLVFIPAVIRWQSCGFVKYSWTCLGPSMLMLCLALNLWPARMSAAKRGCSERVCR